MIVNATGSTIRKYHVEMPENNSLPAIFSSIMNTHEARVKKQQTDPQITLIKIFVKKFTAICKELNPLCGINRYSMVFGTIPSSQKEP